MLFFTYTLSASILRRREILHQKIIFFCTLNIGLASGDVTIKNTKYETFKNPIFEYNVKDYGSINFP